METTRVMKFSLKKPNLVSIIIIFFKLIDFPWHPFEFLISIFHLFPFSQNAIAPCRNAGIVVTPSGALLVALIGVSMEVVAVSAALVDDVVPVVAVLLTFVPMDLLMDTGPPMDLLMDTRTGLLLPLDLPMACPMVCPTDRLPRLLMVRPRLLLRMKCATHNRKKSMPPSRKPFVVPWKT